MEQVLVFIVIIISLFLFIQGKIRYDFVALIALSILAVFNVVPTDKVFSGFSHPAVITVAAILVVSSALIKTGAINQIVEVLNRNGKNISIRILSLCGLTAVLSAFMNNVGALALIMPVAIKIGKENKISPSYLLMPVAFSSLLGGLMTEIGTPPNLIISSYRAEIGLKPFSFFDFFPVGVGITIVGVTFIGIVGWKLIPIRKKVDENQDQFNIENYLSEVYIDETCKLEGYTIRDMQIENKMDINILSIVRDGINIISPNANKELECGDIMVIKTDPEDLSNILKNTGLKLRGTKIDEDNTNRLLNDDEHALVEVVIRDDSLLVGKNAMELQLRNRYNINLVAVSRSGNYSLYRLKNFRFHPGDILLVQVPSENLNGLYNNLRLLPLAQRNIELDPSNTKLNRTLALTIFIASIIITTSGIVPVQVSFTIAAILMVLFKVISIKDFYDAIEWPIIIMLGALLPVGEALETSGGAESIANFMMLGSNFLSPTLMMALLMTTTILLTNLINNAASAVLMAPIAVNLAYQMNVAIDPMLMAVAVASSSAFLTPIGHQSNTLVMGPGGYKFEDYWRLGLPLSIISVVVAIPLILLVWPF